MQSILGAKRWHYLKFHHVYHHHPFFIIFMVTMSPSVAMSLSTRGNESSYPITTLSPPTNFRRSTGI